MSYYPNILESIGHTPLIKLNRLSGEVDATIALKAEFFNPLGSVKDRIGTAMIGAAAHLPVNPARVIDGFKADGGIVTVCYEGVLDMPLEQRPAPFEIILETPQLADEEDQVAAGMAALDRLLVEYPRFISYGQDP